MAAVEDLRLHAAVSAVLNRYALGIDTRDWALFRSVFAPRLKLDFSAWHGGEASEIEADSWVEQVKARQSGFNGTQHQMTNQTVVRDGLGARSITYVVARHYLCIDGEHHVQAIGGAYHNRLVVIEGAWRICSARLQVMWTKGDRGLFDIAAARARVGS